MKRENENGLFMPLAICALILSLLLILVTDASRLFAKKSTATAEVHILVENMDRAVAQALTEETDFSLNDGTACNALSIGEIEPQSVRTETRDGRILSLPSGRLFCADLTLRVPGKITEDGFLAGGSHRLLVGSRVQIDGKRVTAEGILLSIAVEETAQTQKFSLAFGLAGKRVLRCRSHTKQPS